MRQRRNWSMLLISSLLFLSNCASIPDVPICAEVSMSKGVCTYTVSGKNIEVDDEHPLDGETWFDIRAKALAVPAKSYAALKAWMIKQCKRTKKCEVDIDSWDRGLDTK